MTCKDPTSLIVQDRKRGVAEPETADHDVQIVTRRRPSPSRPAPPRIP